MIYKEKLWLCTRLLGSQGYHALLGSPFRYKSWLWVRSSMKAEPVFIAENGYLIDVVKFIFINC